MKRKSKGKKNGNGKKAERHSRIDSAVQALKASPMASKEEWIKAADKLYAKHGGSSNLNESAWAVRHTYAVLRALGSIEEKEDGTLSLKK
jgi:hypothetical protein